MESFHAPVAGGVIRSAQIHRSWAMRRHLEAGTSRALTSYSLVYITKGRGIFRDERHKEPINIAAGDLIFLFPGIEHAYGPVAGESWDEINIDFFGPVFDGWMGTGLLDPEKPVRHLGPPHQWLKRFHSVVLPLARHGVEPTLRDSGKLIELISDMCSTWQDPRRDAEVEWAAKARAKLLSRPTNKKLDLIQEARQFGLGEQAYRKKFKHLCGITPTLFYSRRLIQLACHRLISSNESVKEIGLTLGFGSEHYFSRRFKQITGMSPSEYRLQKLE